MRARHLAAPRTAAAAIVVVVLVASCGPPLARDHSRATMVDLSGRIVAGQGARPAHPARLEFRHGIETAQLANGMRFALIRDHRTSMATIDLRYDVGAAVDPPGLAGLAHLVEHVMFQVRPAPGEPTIGDQLHQLALYTNANTTWDETHYTTTVPAEQLERALELEGQRMRATCAQLDERVLARELDVVLAEEAERASPAAALVHQLHTVIYGAGHPYAREVGSREVARATRADVCAFIEAHYTPHAASLVVTGPFELAAVRATIERTFGPIPLAITAVSRPIAAPALAGQVNRMTAAVVRPTAVVAFAYPRWGSVGALPAILAGRLLARELEKADADMSWIVDSGVTVLGGPRAPVLAAVLEVADADALDGAADEVFRRVARLLDLGNYDAAPVLSQVLLEQMLRWDDLLSRGGWVADFLQHADHQRFMIEDLEAATEGWERHRLATVSALRPDRARVLLLDPGGRTGSARIIDAGAGGTHALAPWRPTIDPAEADRPLAIEQRPPLVAIEQYVLANGLVVALAPDPLSPIVDARLVFPVGTAHQPPDQPVLATAAAVLLSTPTRGGNPLRPQVRSTVGGAIQDDVDVNEVSTTFSRRGVAEASVGFIAALSERVRAGLYDPRMLRLLEAALRAEEREVTRGAADDDALAQELRFREHLFGARHPYASTPPRMGAALDRLDVARLAAWKAAHYRARGATLVVSGRFDVAAVKRAIEAQLGRWPADEAATLPPVPQARPPAGPAWLAIEERRAGQVGVRLGFAAASLHDGDRAARAVLSEMVLDQVRDVREGLGASYGIHAVYIGGVAGSALLVHGSVTDERAGAAVARVLAAVDLLRDDTATRRAAFVRARRRVLGQVQARVAGATTMATQMAGAAARGEPLDGLDRLATEIAALTVDDLTRVATLDLDRGRMVLELRGRRAPVAAAFATLAVAPGWMVPSTPAPPAPLAPPAPVITASVGRDGPPPEPRRPRRRPPAAPPAPPPADGPTGPEDWLTVRPAVGDGPYALYHGEREITLETFIRTLGHDAVADKMVRRRRMRRGLMIGGFGALGAGAIYSVTAASCDELRWGSPEAEACAAARHRRRVIATGLVVGGGALGLIGLQLKTGRLDEASARHLANQYNFRRRRAASTGAGAGAGAGELTLRATVTPEGEGLGLGLTLGGHF